MNKTDACPTNLRDVEEASKRLGCGNDIFGNNQYMCLPNVNKTSLIEFCYEGIMGIQEKGNCLEVNVLDGKLHTYECNTFSTGCPSNHYWNQDFFRYSGCQNISLKHRCYTLDPSCPDLLKNDSNDDDLNTNYFNYAIVAGILIMILTIVILTVLFLYKRKRREKNTENTTEELHTNMTHLLPKYLKDETQSTSKHTENKDGPDLLHVPSPVKEMVWRIEMPKKYFGKR
ncbi:uncharacterized protein LOC144625490 [Crassostrea virginica]